MQSRTNSSNINIKIAGEGDTENSACIRYCKSETAVKGSIFTEENILIFVQEGQLELSFGSSSYKAESHQIVFIRKGITLEYSSRDPSTAVMVFVLKKELIVGFAKQSKLVNTANDFFESIVIHDASCRLLAYISSLQIYFRQEAIISANLAKIKMTELLFFLSENDQSIFNQVLNVREYFRPDISGILEENLTNAISLSQLARIAGRSVSSLRRDFLSAYNMPPSSWIRQVENNGGISMPDLR